MVGSRQVEVWKSAWEGRERSRQSHSERPVGPEGGGAAGWEAAASAGSWVTLSREATGGLHAWALQDPICPRSTLAALGGEWTRGGCRGHPGRSADRPEAPDFFSPSEIGSPAATWPGGYAGCTGGQGFFHISDGQEKEGK